VVSAEKVNVHNRWMTFEGRAPRLRRVDAIHTLVRPSRLEHHQDNSGTLRIVQGTTNSHSQELIKMASNGFAFALTPNWKDLYDFT